MVLSIARKLVCSWLSSWEWLVTKFAGWDLSRQLEIDPIARVSMPQRDTGQDRETHQLHQHMSWICARLRRFPYWPAGHWHLAEAAYLTGDIETCFAALQAVKKLSITSKVRQRACIRLEALCYMAYGQFSHAESLLRPLIESGGGDNAVAQDLAAALMASSREREAWDLLLSIPEDQRDPHVLSAIRYLREKLNESAT